MESQKLKTGLIEVTGESVPEKSDEIKAFVIVTLTVSNLRHSVGMLDIFGEKTIADIKEEYPLSEDCTHIIKQPRPIECKENEFIADKLHSIIKDFTDNRSALKSSVNISIGGMRVILGPLGNADGFPYAIEDNGQDKIKKTNFLAYKTAYQQQTDMVDATGFNHELVKDGELLKNSLLFMIKPHTIVTMCMQLNVAAKTV